MPNRVIKDRWLSSPTLDLVSADGERLFARLMLVADDFGRFEARPQQVLARCFPNRVGSMLASDVDRWLHELVTAVTPGEAHGPIRLYRVGGRVYGCFLNWDSYQKRRAKHSKYPAPPGDGWVEVQETYRVTEYALSVPALPTWKEENMRAACGGLPADADTPETHAGRAPTSASTLPTSASTCTTSANICGSRIENRESRIEKREGGRVDNFVDNPDACDNPSASAHAPLPESPILRDEIIQNQLCMLRQLNPQHWVELGRLFRAWVYFNPPVEVVLNALRSTIRHGPHKPCAYLVSIIRKETPNFHERNAIEAHEQRKTESRSDGAVQAVGDVLAAMARRGSKSAGSPVGETSRESPTTEPPGGSIAAQAPALEGGEA
jgi:hypothetical protein